MRATLKSDWQDVCEEDGARVRRLSVIGGWLYQVQTGVRLAIYDPERYEPCYGAPTFVPDVRR